MKKFILLLIIPFLIFGQNKKELLNIINKQKLEIENLKSSIDLNSRNLITDCNKKSEKLKKSLNYYSNTILSNTLFETPSFFEEEKLSSLRLVPYLEKENRGYLKIENDLIEDSISFIVSDNENFQLLFIENLIGDLNGDRVDDFILLGNNGLFFFKISNEPWFYVSSNQVTEKQSKYIRENNIYVETINSLFFSEIKNGKITMITEDMYYKSKYDEYVYPISIQEVTIDEVRSLYGWDRARLELAEEIKK